MKLRPRTSIGLVRTRYEREKRLSLVGVLALALALSLPMPAAAAPQATDTVGDKAAGKLKIRLAALPDVTMRSGVLVDEEGRVLWARNASSRRQMASITKIMTAVVALEREKDLNRVIKVPPIAIRVGESAVELRAGEEIKLRKLLEDMLVKSGNDAATAVAIGVAGSPEEFVKLMNAKAAELGLKNTKFKNVHGLDQAGHYSSARDIEALSRYAMQNAEFRRIVGIKSIVIGKGKAARRVPASNWLLTNYKGATGIKTGWTDGAGYSISASAERNGIKLYAVVLGTASERKRFVEAQELFDWGFTHYRPQDLASKGSIVAETPVRDYLDVTIPVAVSADSSATVIDLLGPITRTVSVESSLSAPVGKGQKVGVLTFTQADRVLASIPLVTTKAVRAPTRLERLSIAVVRLWQRVFG